jgi:hypothetical protein
MSPPEKPERPNSLEFGRGDSFGDPSRDFFISGGTLPADSPSYVERQADRILFESLVRGRYCYVLNARQMGKSSLSVQTIGKLERVGIRTTFIDLTRLGGKNVSAEQWYTGIAFEMARELGRRSQMAMYWKEHVAEGPMLRLFGAIHDVLLTSEEGQEPTPLVVFIDEIDATRSLPFDSDEFFSAIRECFNRRVFDPVYSKLTFCLLGVAVPSDLIRNPATTPFNIGERVYVEDFTLDELEAFATKLGENGEKIIERVHYWTGGHPFLSQSLCRSLARMSPPISVESVDEVVNRDLFDFRARDSNVNLADVSNIALHYGDSEDDPMKFRADLLSAYQRVWSGKHVPDDESNRVAALLKLSGIARSDGRFLHVRNRIYRHVFDLKWIAENMPGQELRRQKQSFRRGVRRTTLIAGSILAVIGTLAVFTWTSRVAAIAARKQLDYELYVADINSLRTYYDNGDTGRIETILKRHENSPYRGFEWGYWQRRFHDAPEEYTLNYTAPGKREVGMMSADGKEICISDMLTDTATIVSRATRQVVSTSKGANSGVIGQVGTDWVRFAMRGSEVAVSDVRTGIDTQSLRDPGYGQIALVHPPHSQFALTEESHLGALRDQRIVIWDVAKGTPVFSLDVPCEFMSFLSMSEDGQHFSYGVEPSGTANKPKIRFVAYDRRKSAPIDQFDIDVGSDLLCSFQKSVRFIFRTPGQEIVVRDSSLHRTELVPSFPEGLPEQLMPTQDEKSIIALYSTGQCVIRDFPSKANPRVRSNVSAISLGNLDGELVASATSVRVYHSQNSAIPQIITQGYRVTRSTDGRLNVFSNFPNTIRKIVEADYLPAGELPPARGQRDYTYNGRWSVSNSKGGRHNVLSDADGVFPDRKIPGTASIWSSSIGPSNFAIWDQNAFDLSLVDASTGILKWHHPLRSLQAMWVSPDGSRLFLVRDNVILEVYDTKSGGLIRKITAHNMGPLYVTFTRNSDAFFTCGGDGRVVLWDMASTRKLMEFRGNALRGATCADLSPDGKRVATASQSGSWQLWDSSNGVQLLDVEASKRPLTSVVFCADGNRIITAGSDDQVRVWSATDQNPTVNLPINRSWLSEVRE